MSRKYATGLALCACLLAGCGGGFTDMGSTTIADGGITVTHGLVTLNAPGAPEAAITAAGDLSIGSEHVAVNVSERTQLQHYYQNALAVREHGIATGKAGVAVAARSLKGAAEQVAGVDDKDNDAKVAAQSDQLNRTAAGICEDIARIKAAQDALAGQLAAFKPYSRILGADAADCSSDAQG